MSANSRRLSTPKGQMTRGANSGPAIMLLPPHLRATFMPNPPLAPEPPLHKPKRRQAWTGVSQYLKLMGKSPPPPRIILPTPQSLKDERRRLKKEKHEVEVLQPLIEKFRKEQRDCGGEFQGMNCYNTLFVGRLAYEVTERKLLREMEAFGPIKDIRIVTDDKKRSKYAFVEYEHEEDMKRAYRAADGMKLEGREIVVDVERGHTVPTWLPRRLGGGLGGTRLGGKDENVTRPGRYDPSRPEASIAPMAPGMGRGLMPGGPPPMPPQAPYRYPPMGPPGGPGPALGPPTSYGSRGRGGGDRYAGGGPSPTSMGMGGPPRDWDRDHGGGGGGDWSRGSGSKRPRSNSPDRDRRHSSSRHRNRY